MAGTAAAPSTGATRSNEADGSMTCKGHSGSIEEVTEERMADIRRQVVGEGNETLDQLEQMVYAARVDDMPVFDCMVVIGDRVLHPGQNQAFFSHVEQQVYKLVIHGGYCFERHSTGEIKLTVPKDAWSLKIPSTMHLHPSRTCCGMFQVLVVFEEGDCAKIQERHEASALHLHDVTYDEGLFGEEDAREHMRAKEEWPSTGCWPDIPMPP